MENILKLLKNNNKLPLLFRLIGKEDFYQLDKKGILVYKSKRNQTKYCHVSPSNKPIAKVLNIKNGKIL